jgi:hypothetical protein
MTVASDAQRVTPRELAAVAVYLVWSLGIIALAAWVAPA